MKIKVDITRVTVFASGQVLTLTIPELHTQKTALPFLKFYFKGEKFKILELKRERNIAIPVVGDSVSQSIYEFYDSTAMIDTYPEPGNGSEVK